MGKISYLIFILAIGWPIAIQSMETSENNQITQSPYYFLSGKKITLIGNDKKQFQEYEIIATLSETIKNIQHSINHSSAKSIYIEQLSTDELFRAMNILKNSVKQHGYIQTVRDLAGEQINNSIYYTNEAIVRFLTLHRSVLNKKLASIMHCLGVSNSFFEKLLHAKYIEINTSLPYIFTNDLGSYLKQFLSKVDIHEIKKKIQLNLFLSTSQKETNTTWSPDKKYYIIQSKDFSSIVDSSTSAQLKNIEHASQPCQYYWSPTGKNLAIIIKDTVHIWNEITNELVPLDIDCKYIQWTPNGKQLGLVKNESELNKKDVCCIKIFSSETYKLVAEFEYDCFSFIWSPNNIHLVANEYNTSTIKKNYILDSRLNNCLATFQSSSLPTWSANGKYLAFIYNNLHEKNLLIIWSQEYTEKTINSKSNETLNNSITVIFPTAITTIYSAYNSNNFFISGLSPNTIWNCVYIFNIRSKIITAVLNHYYITNFVYNSHDKLFITMSNQKTVRLWDLHGKSWGNFLIKENIVPNSLKLDPNSNQLSALNARQHVTELVWNFEYIEKIIAYIENNISPAELLLLATIQRSYTEKQLYIMDNASQKIFNNFSAQDHEIGDYIREKIKPLIQFNTINDISQNSVH